MPEVYHVKAKHPGKPHVFVAIPVGRPVEAAFLEFMWNVQADLTEKGIAADLYMLANHCHVDDCRNMCVHVFLNETTCDEFVFLDSDTVSSGDAVSHLLSFDRDVIAGIYPYKRDEEGYPVHLPPGPITAEPDGAILARRVPTGCLRIKRHVLEKMADASPKYYNSEAPREKGKPIAEIFRRETDEKGDRWGGDYNFCRRWLALGGQIHITPKLFFQHFGVKAYGGNVGRYICRVNGVQTPEFIEAFAALRGGHPLSAHFGRLVADWGNEYCAGPDLLEALYWIARDANGPILETGSGLSSLVLAAANPDQMVHALEHDLQWLIKTKTAADQLGVDNLTLHYAPLQSHEGVGIWYGVTTELPDAFSVAFCDGPQRRWGRRGFYKLMGARIRNATVVLDDAFDPKVLEEAQAWAKEAGRVLHVMGGQPREFAVSPRPGGCVSSMAA